MQLSELASISPLLGRRLFAVFDKDGSGTVEWQEFMAGMSGCCSAAPEEKFALCFQLYDLDGDGFLVPAELDAMLSAYIIGSAKLAAEACDVMELEELDMDAEFDEDNWGACDTTLH
jgi:Ca2+-binding EF-hand superfamily protein